MTRTAIEPSVEVARILRDRRKELGWTLRDVEARSRQLGRAIHFTTLARVERAEVDPGVLRLHTLFKLYDLPMRLLEDLLEVEEFVGDIPARASTTTTYAEAMKAWKSGDLRQAFAGLARLRRSAGKDAASDPERQKALIGLAVAIASAGRYRLAKQLIEDVLAEPLGPELLVPALVEAANCWHRLGSPRVAIGFLESADKEVAPTASRHRALVAHARASVLATLRDFVGSESALVQAIDHYRAAGDAFGEGQALGVRVRLLVEQEDLPGALAAVRAARAHAESHGHGRLLIQRILDEGHLLCTSGESTRGVETLHDGLARAVATQDDMMQFYGHYYLWKAYAAVNDHQRSGMELSAARYFVQHIDARVPEAIEVASVSK